MKLRLRAPSPALVIAIIALFVSLSGTAVAAGVVPMAKRALFANNAGKLQGKSARQIAALPGPATSLEGLKAEDIAGMPSPATTAMVEPTRIRKSVDRQRPPTARKNPSP